MELSLGFSQPVTKTTNFSRRCKVGKRFIRQQASANVSNLEGVSTLQHTVQLGETLSQLSRVYGIPVDEIANQNSIVNKNLIIEGQSLAIPQSVSPQSSTVSQAVAQPVFTMPAQSKERVFGLLLGFAAMYCVQALFKFLKSTLLRRKKKTQIDDSEKQQIKLENLEWQKNRMHSALVYDRDRVANGNGEVLAVADERQTLPCIEVEENGEELSQYRKWLKSARFPESELYISGESSSRGGTRKETFSS